MRTIIFTVTLFFLTVSVSAQTYYKLSACGNDPLKYIEKNYEDGESRYIGNMVKYFVDECELTPQGTWIFGTAQKPFINIIQYAENYIIGNSKNKKI